MPDSYDAALGAAIAWLSILLAGIAYAVVTGL